MFSQNELVFKNYYGYNKILGIWNCYTQFKLNHYLINDKGYLNISDENVIISVKFLFEQYVSKYSLPKIYGRSTL